ncbi:hypothetical protein K7432_007893 [Basidiobolus ranarum]|uniref:Uncharacterized protein n=1 Tax=Basidiobolus ranarum TaxID=34480 RepID=A0ABR2WSK6_9FUNG
MLFAAIAVVAVSLGAAKLCKDKMSQRKLRKLESKKAKVQRKLSKCGRKLSRKFGGFLQCSHSPTTVERVPTPNPQLGLNEQQLGAQSKQEQPIAQLKQQSWVNVTAEEARDAQELPPSYESSVSYPVIHKEGKC